MAAIQPTVRRRDDDPNNFKFTFSRELSTTVIRKGGEREPIPSLRHRCMKKSEYQSGENGGLVDFLLDEEDRTIFDRKRGISVFSREEALPSLIGQKKTKLWLLDTNTAFPEELHIEFTNNTHAVISPRSGVNVETLETMLKCLPWKKLYDNKGKRQGEPRCST